MTRYFSVRPVAVGALEVECLSSVLQRLAVAHGVTRHQFVTSLRDWWKAERGRHLPRCEELRWDGYSPNVSLAIEALRDALGVDLKGCTLLPLSSVCAANCIGSIAHSRSWCPGCFNDDITSGEPTYDRLLWRVQGYQRCSLHRLRLRSSCPHCDGYQTRDASREELHLCTFCRQSLAAKVTKAEYAPRPEFGEEQIETLVRGISSIAAVQNQPLRKFFQGIEDADKYVAKHLGDIIHNRRLPAKPQLTTLIAVATHFGVDVRQLITDPTEAARQAALDIKRPPKTRVTRPSSHLRQKRTAWFKAKLELAIQSGPPFSSAEELCRNNDFSISAARGTFPALTAALSGKYLEWKKSKASNSRRRAIAAIAARADMRAQLTVKEFVAQVCAASGAPVHMVRGLVDCSSDGSL
ncbi:TniQ family protein [Xanthomonas sp. 1678]|uniref:TniQ family protein n=1 Tax=Xanthomonas sp. 1678 TaxID=3158788 RepID=UPI00286463FC|nr:hypothetical protein [Xanthomonas translucens]